MTNEEREQALLDLLGEAEILVNTAPTMGISYDRPAWYAWMAKRTAWLNKLSHTLIVDMSKEPKDEATVTDVRAGKPLLLPSDSYWNVTYSQDGNEYALVWQKAWGDPPNVGDRIHVEVDAIMSPKRTSIVRKAGE